MALERCYSSVLIYKQEALGMVGAFETSKTIYSDASSNTATPPNSS